jgi:hypothetical protein
MCPQSALPIKGLFDGNSAGKHIVITANLTLRKCLGFKTLFQAIPQELGDVQIRFS